MREKLSKYFTSLILLTIFSGVFTTFESTGQHPFLKPMVSNSKLKNSEINSIYQDKKGMIWITCSNGLYTYNGLTVKEIELPDTLKSYNVTAITQDKNDNYWLGFNNGLILTFDHFNTFTRSLKIPAISSKITVIHQDNTHNIWFCTYGDGAFVLSEDTVNHLHIENGITDNFIYCLEEDSNGKIWLGTDNGINICTIEPGRINTESFTVNDGLPDFIVRSMKFDKKSKIWVGMHDQGICYYDMESGSFYHPEELKDWDLGTVNDILILNDRIWIVSESGGIAEYFTSSRDLAFHEAGQELQYSKFHSIMDDNEGNVWLISKSDIWLSLGNKLEYLNLVDNSRLQNIHALTVDQNNNVWFSNDSGIYCYNPYGKPSRELTYYTVAINLTRQKIISLYRDSYGFIWAGTFGEGVIRLDPETETQKIFSQREGLINGNVLSISGNNQEIWFGTLGGASKITFNNQLKNISYQPKFQNFTKAEGLINNYIYQVHIAEDGKVYFATDGNGIIKYENSKFVNIGKRHGFDNKVVYSVTSDSTGTVWMNISNEGVFRYDQENFERIYKDKEHNDLSFSGLSMNKNELIILYDNGIDVYNLKSSSLRHFESNAGLENIYPDLNTIAKDSRNNIWIGTSKGIVKYSNPEANIWEFPVTVMQDVSLFLKSFDYNSNSTFQHNENHFSFSFSGLWYQYPEKVEYQFKLEGHDIEWIRSKNPEAVYSDLQPGEYTFRVRSGLYNNFPEQGELTYSFRIKKPFHQTLWFYLVSAIILFLVVFAIVQIRIRQIRKKQERIQENIKFQFENLKSQINPHFLFNSFSTLIALIEDDSKAAVSYVEELSVLFRNILEFRDKDVISLEEEMIIAKNYIAIQKKRFGDNLIINTDNIPESSNIRIPPLTIQLLIENAIKHNVVSFNKPLFIDIFTDQKDRKIIVKNNIQEKNEDVYSSGIGIKNIINRYKILTDEKVMVIKEDKIFTIKLPHL